MGETLAVLGCGTMGQAIVAGLLRAGLATDQVVATVRRTERAQQLSGKLGIEVSTDNVAACKGAKVVVITLKPQRMKEILDKDAMRQALAGTLVISVAAGTMPRRSGPPVERMP